MLNGFAGMLATPAGAAAVATALTGLVCVESRWMPWSPFFLLFAVLAPAVPLSLGTYAFGDAVALWRAHGTFIVALGGIMLVWEHGIAYAWYEKGLLPRLGKSGMPAFSPTSALSLLMDAASGKKGMGAIPSQVIFGMYTLLWAPIAEELFYWGYLYSSLRQGLSIAAGILITSCFFGIRHAAHFLFLGRDLPIFAAGVWAFSTAVTAALNCALYEKTHSLYPLIAMHVVSNVLFLFHTEAKAKTQLRPESSS